MDPALGSRAAAAPRFHLTFDIDWAPDACIAEVAYLLDRAGVRATFLVTHACDVLADLARAGHRLGIHPNFLPRSSHGDSAADVVGHLLEIVPHASVMRTHALVQSTPLLIEVLRAAPQLTLDLSTFTYGFPHVGRFAFAFDDVRMDRINYNWEDDAAFVDPEFDWSMPRFHGPLTVFDFHPIHVALNSRDASAYRRLKGLLGSTPLWRASATDLSRARGREPGTRDFLEAVLAAGAVSTDLEEIA